jgi:N-acetyl-alpha-D-glucosaminyl L-malate synthase BshA
MNQPLKIGIVCYPTYGGSGVIATELGKGLAERGHQIHFISYAMPAPGFYEGNIFYHEVEMPTLLFDFPLYTPALASKIVEVAQFEKLTSSMPTMRSPMPQAHIWPGRYRRIAQAITTAWNRYHAVGLEPSFLAVMKFSIEQSDGVTAVSRFLKEKTLTNYGIDKDIRVIPNFVDTEKYTRVECMQVRERFAPANERILVHISNFRAVKRVADVIRIFNEVQQKVPAHLILVGDGPDRSSCELLVRELGIQERVRFLGKQTELVQILSSADLMLMPSQSESFGLAALEAMACGVPVISSSVGGLPELQVHGQTGYIAEIGDVGRMARYAIELLGNDTKMALFRQACRNRAVEHFDLKRIVTMYEEYYRECAAT